MSYKEQVRPGKSLITGDGIAPGSIDLQHLSPGLFSEFRQIQLHTHTGVKSSRVRIQDLDGYFPASGFFMYSTTKVKYLVTIVAGVLTVTAA